MTDRKEEPLIMRRACRRKVLFAAVALILMLAGCGANTATTGDGVNMGKKTDANVDVMGVRYNLYSNGYAAIVQVLNPYCVLSETITYQEKEYTVAAIEQGSVTGVGIFNSLGVKEAPETLKLPDTLTSLPGSALADCSSSVIILPEKVKFIGANVFAGCANIETVEFPETVEQICAYGLFRGCTNLKNVTLPEDVEYLLDTGHLFSECAELEEVTIPGGFNRLGEYTFSNCTVLSDITLKEGITTVSAHAFHGLPALETIVFPESVTEIRDMTFFDCFNLKDVWLPDGLSDVPAHMFKQSYGQYDTDVSGITIHVKESLVEYVQNLYPDAKVVAK